MMSFLDLMGSQRSWQMISKIFGKNRRISPDHFTFTYSEGQGHETQSPLPKKLPASIQYVATPKQMDTHPWTKSYLQIHTPKITQASNNRARAKFVSSCTNLTIRARYSVKQSS